MEARGTRLCFVGPTMGGTAIHECRVGKADQRWEVGPWERVSVSRAAARYPVYSLDGNSIFSPARLWGVSRHQVRALRIQPFIPSWALRTP